MTEVSDTLKQAHEAVVESGVPEELHEVAFREAVRLITMSAAAPRRSSTGTARLWTQHVLSSAAAPADTSAPPVATVSEDEMYDRVVSQTDVDRDKLELLVHLDDDGPRIDMAGLKLGKNNAERTRAVAQILAIVRGFGLGEEATEVSIIRDECNRLKVYDSANFASQVGKIPGFVLSGSGSNRKIRPRGPGIQAFPALVDNLIED
jgi:hypothetical protein